MAAANKTPMVGKLTLCVVSGRNLKDMDLLTKMSVYVTLKCGKEEFKTQVQNKCGTAPNFNQSFIFNLEGKEDALHVNVYSKEMLSDGHIGRIDIPLHNLVKTDKQCDYNLNSPSDFKKVTGDLILKCESFVGTGAPNPAVHAAPAPAAAPVQQQQQMMMQQPQMMMQQQQMMAAQPRVVMMAAPQPQLVQGADGKLYAIQQPGMVAQPQVMYMQAQPNVMYVQQK